jgi:hypothetical protein
MPLDPEKLAAMKASTEHAVAGLAHGHMPIPVVPNMLGLAEDVLTLLAEVDNMRSLLRSLRFAGANAGDEPCCPACRAERDEPCKSTCKLASFFPGETKESEEAKAEQSESERIKQT